MSSLEDAMIEQEIEDYWMDQGEAVYREMCEDDWPDDDDDLLEEVEDEQEGARRNSHSRPFIP